MQAGPEFTMNVICTESLCKSYGSREVLHDLSVGIAEGKLVGFLGPNGAGKTTTIRVLLGLLKATSGRTSILGKDCWHDGPSIRSAVGYLPGELRFYPGLTGRRTLEFLASARSSTVPGRLPGFSRDSTSTLMAASGTIPVA